MPTDMAERNALVVDDSRAARYAMRKYLERYRYEVATAEDGSQALRYLRDHRPLVIFLDYLMPGPSGLEILHALKKDPGTMRIPVVMCTSVEKPELLQQARTSGAIEVLPKPPGLAQLQKLLEMLEAAADTPAVIIEPEAAEVAVEPTDGGAIAVPESAERFVVLQGEINQGLRRLTEDIFVQIAELKAQLVRMQETPLTPEECDAFRQIAREEADALNQAVYRELSLIRQRLEAIDQMQRQERSEVLVAARVMAAQEAQAIARHTMKDAASQLSGRLTDAIHKALGKP